MKKKNKKISFQNLCIQHVLTINYIECSLVYTLTIYFLCKVHFDKRFQNNTMNWMDLSLYVQSWILLCSLFLHSLLHLSLFCPLHVPLTSFPFLFFTFSVFLFPLLPLLFHFFSFLFLTFCCFTWFFCFFFCFFFFF